MIFEGLLIKVSSSIKRLNSHVFAHLGDLLARLLEAPDALSVALPVLRELWRVGHLVISEVSAEDLVHELTVSDLLLQILVSLLSALTDDAIVMHMEVVVSGVDHLKLLLLGSVRGEVEHVCSLCHEHLKRGCLSLADTLEVANWLVLPGEVAKLLD